MAALLLSIAAPRSPRGSSPRPLRSSFLQWTHTRRARRNIAEVAEGRLFPPLICGFDLLLPSPPGVHCWLYSTQSGEEL